jgi:hypothetical protein
LRRSLDSDIDLSNETESEFTPYLFVAVTGYCRKIMAEKETRKSNISGQVKHTIKHANKNWCEDRILVNVLKK